MTEIVVTELGSKPFHLRGPLNLSALDSVFSVLIENNKKIDKQTLKKQYKALKADRYFDDYTSYNTTDTKIVRARIKVVYKYLLNN